MKKNYLKLIYYKLFEYYDRKFKKLNPIIWQKRKLHFLKDEEKFKKEKTKFQKILN
ncbi:hypothetical protein HOG21_02880 [bacterium]|jgi:hypothetical protein|nr:hypothetical protein [bacterium]